MKHTARYYHWLAIFSIIVWGTTFVSTKVLLLNGLTPPEIFLYRFVLAYLCILFWAPRRLFADNWKDEGLMVLAGISGGSLYFYAENTALGITLASNVSLIIAATPVLTALLACAVYRQERLQARLVFGSLIALVGVALVVFNGSFILEINPSGDLLALLAAVLWAVYSLVLKRLENGYPVLFITRKIFFYGLLTLLPVLAVSPVSPLPVLVRPVVWGNLVFLGVIASMLCYLMWNVALKNLGVVRVTNYIYINPLVTLVASSVVLHEVITGVAILGSVLILSGVYIAENGVRRPGRLQKA